MTRIFALDAILVALGIGLVGAIIALIIRLVKGDGASALLRALETFLTAALGAFLARAFISLVLDLGGNTDATVVVTSLLFTIWPGVINLVSWIFGHPVFGADAVLWIALVIGGLVGLNDGLWKIQRWLGFGVLTFLLDVTWGLGGSTNGALLHLINIVWGDHGDGDAENRQSAHRYASGFRLKSGFAFTQGAVMSNMGGHGPGSPLHNHEFIHVWQNRILGPFFWFSYMGWMALLFLPALIAGLIGKSVGNTILYWCYYDDPWEVMAYSIANPTSRTGPGWQCWPLGLAIPLNVLGIAGLGAFFAWIVSVGF
ncbi:hypothetical protein [Inquilinus sp.]|jgi:hypothetical protein|uniref:hypothetical protein n=1 Tax=Inquilinus sp. TaxID=1932117 RepID=UPI003783048C